MLRYLDEILGLSAEEAPWLEEKQLPLYLRSGRAYSILRLQGMEALLVRMDAAEFRLAAFEKQLIKLAEYWPGGQIVLCFQKLTAYQRKALIEHRIPFLVPGSQIFFPQLGMMLQERMPAVRKAPERLTAAAQQLLLYLLYRGDVRPTGKAALAHQLGVSPMNITRAVQVLEELSLVRTEKRGRCDYVSPLETGRGLYEKARPYLISPVQKKLYVKRLPEFEQFPLCGESALAAVSMLNPPAVSCRAVGRSVNRMLLDKETVDPAWSREEEYLELELWKYDPQLLTQNGRVDVVSLACSLKENSDERVEQAVEGMLEVYKW